MIDILCNCFNSFNCYLILFIAFILYLNRRISKRNEVKRVQQEAAINSLPKRSEQCPQEYPNGWLPVYDSHDLKKGQVKPIFALGRDLVIYRGTSGKVYVFDAYCPHLGANLGVGGTVVGEDIKCHFHGWQFDDQGDCKSIPGLEDNSIPKATIRKWRCDEVNDFIYVWHHLEGKDPEWFMTKLNEIDSLVYRSKYNLHSNCYIQEITENEADPVHFEYLHGTQAVIPKFLQKVIKLDMILIDWKTCDAPNTHCTQLKISGQLKLGPFTLMRAFIRMKSTGPAHLTYKVQLNIGVKLNFVGFTNVITLGHFKQVLVMKWYSETTIFGLFVGRLMAPIIGFLGESDVEVWNTKVFLRNPTFTKLDESIVKVRRWYKQFFSDNSKDNHPYLEYN